MLTALPIAGAMTLTPLVMYIWRTLDPVRPASGLEDYDEEELKVRNGWINGVALIFCLLGVVSPFILFGKKINEIGWPSLGFQFGMAVILPVLCISAITLPQGLRRWEEFWRYYELKYRINIHSIFVFYAMMSALGFTSIFALIKRGVW